MIYCKLKGGLGNMLFQIAAAKSLAIDNNTDCYFPNLLEHLKYLDIDKTHNPELNHSNEYIQILKKLKVNSLPQNRTSLITYPFDFIETPTIKENTIIDGFFQSEKYFSHNRNEILKFLNFDFIEKESIEKKYEFIFSKRCTSIHIRRGDYLKYPNHHPVQTSKYYLDAIEILNKDTDLFIVFSDDINWCKENLKLDNIIYIEGEKDYIELYLMKNCHNNITSNSSFSWWGAWLNENPSKKVVGPLIWFGNAIKHNTGDILPEKWIKI
jgi:hypothetical protein